MYIEDESCIKCYACGGSINIMKENDVYVAKCSKCQSKAELREMKCKYCPTKCFMVLSGANIAVVSIDPNKS